MRLTSFGVFSLCFFLFFSFFSILTMFSCFVIFVLMKTGYVRRLGPPPSSWPWPLPTRGRANNIWPGPSDLPVGSGPVRGPQGPGPDRGQSTYHPSPACNRSNPDLINDTTQVV